MSSKSHFFNQKSNENSFVLKFRGNNTTVTLPYISTGIYSGVIDWGDGTIVANSYANRSHNYIDNLVRTVTITGDVQGFIGQNNEIILIENFGNGFVIDQNTRFGDCGRLNITATDLPLITTNSFFQMFENCTALVFNESVNDWDVSNVTNFNYALKAPRFSQTLKTWDTSSATSLAFMVNVVNLVDSTLEFNDWDVSNVTNFSQMFRANNYNKPLNNWQINTNNNVNMQRMFRDNTTFNQDISDWNFSKVTSLSQFMSGKSELNYNPLYYDNLLIKWALDPSLGGLTANSIGSAISMGTIKYTSAGASARQSIIDNKGVTLTDGGQV